MIKTIIIEDEIAGQELLKKNLHDHFPECSIDAVVDHVEKAIDLINEIEPDLVFVDIHIKGGTGFDILSRIGSRRFEVIFITAYESYAIQAIKEEALDYILKPINTNELKTGVTKAIERINAKKQVTNSAIVDVTTYKGIERVSKHDIIFLEAEGAYTNIHLAGSKITSTKSIGEYELLLTEAAFYRTHHSFIVNIAHIEKFNKGRSGLLFMKTGHTIPVSQRKMKDFHKRIRAQG